MIIKIKNSFMFFGFIAQGHKAEEITVSKAPTYSVFNG